MSETRFGDSRPYLWYATLLLVCTAAFFLAALISQGIFERVPHVEDEAAYLFQAQVLAQGRLKVPTPPYEISYWSPFVLDYQGQRFGKYPPGYPLLLSLGVRAGEPWIVNALLASLGLWVLAYAGRVIYSPVAGLMAAALGLTVPVFLATSGTLLSHPTSLLFTTVFLWAYASLIRKRADRSQRLYAIVASLALGCLLITRPFDAIGVSLPFAVYLLIRGLRADRDLIRQGVIIAAIVTLFGMLLLVYWFSLAGTIGNPYTLLWPYDRPGFGLNFGPEGYTLATGVRYLRDNLRDLAIGFLGWPGYLNVLFTLLPFILRPRDRWNYLLLASFLSLALLHVTYWYYGGRDAGFPRYYYAGLPMLLLLTARGIELTASALHRLRLQTGLYGASASDTSPPIKSFSRSEICSEGIATLALAGSARESQFSPVFGNPGRANPNLLSLPIYLTLIGLVLYNALIFLPPNLNAFRGKSGITSAPLRVAREAGVTDAIVFVTDVEHWYDFAVFFSANSPTLDSDVVYAIYYNRPQAQSVKELYPDRACYVQSEAQLRPCPF